MVRRGIAPLSSGAETVKSFRPANSSTGLFLLLIGTEAESDQKAKRILRAAAVVECGFPVAVGWSRDNFAIRDASLELLVLESVRTGRSELNGDSVARREVNARIARAAVELEDKLREAFASAKWKSNVDGVDGKANTAVVDAGAATLNIMASRLADAWFHKSPVTHNELLNRIKPSSNAIAAQKALLRAMIEHPREPRLGIDGFPAEGGLYAALIERTGLHRPDPETPEVFRFLPPCDSSPSRLAGLWEVAEDMVRKATSKQISMADVFSVWKAAPFGVRDGLLPVFGVAFILSHLEQLSIYLDGVYQVRVTTMIVDRLIQDFGAVRLRWNEVSEFQQTALHGLASVVAKNNGFGPEVTCPGPLDIAKGLVRVVNDLPQWVLRTTTLPPIAIQVRNLAKTANDPNKFLLDDLPNVLGSQSETGDPSKIIAFVSDGLESLLSAYPSLMDGLETVMLKELRVRGKIPEAITNLRERAEIVRNLTGNYRLDAFATRLATSSNLGPIEGIAALAANKPTRDWVDRDVDQARIEFAALAQEFVKAEGFAHVKGRKDHRLNLAIYSSDPRKDAPVHAEVDITTAENQEVADLTKEILAILTSKQVDRDVALAVVAELGTLLAAQSQETAAQGPKRETA